MDTGYLKCRPFKRRS